MAAPEHHIDPYAHAGRWTEEDFLALPVDRRVELVDGSLVMSPSGSNEHQLLATRLWAALDRAAPDRWTVLPAVNIRVGPDRILIPDVAVLDAPDIRATFNDADRASLVVEVVSPGNSFMDRVIKPQLYARAGIARYLRVEQDHEGPAGHLHALDGGEYREIARGGVIELDHPFVTTIDLVELLS